MYWNQRYLGRDWFFKNYCLALDECGKNINVGYLEIAGDPALLKAVNYARLHPELYPPHGDTTGATTSGVIPSTAKCSNAFTESAALEGTAAAHNTYIASQSAAWLTVKAYDAAEGKTVENAHLNPDGKYSADPGGPIANAGYNNPGEIVEWGSADEAGAVQYWMQDDAASNWGHRNLILDCTKAEAGGAHLAGGPSNYWTVDMGTR